MSRYFNLFRSDLSQLISNTARNISQSFYLGIGSTQPYLYYIEDECYYSYIDSIYNEPALKIADKSDHPLIKQKLKELEVAVQMVHYEELKQQKDRIKRYCGNLGKEVITTEIKKYIKEKKNEEDVWYRKFDNFGYNKKY